MDRKFIINFISKKLNYTNEQKEIIQAIEEAREELDNCRRYFEEVSEPSLVDYAIHSEDAAKTKLSFLLSEAKEKGVQVESSLFLDEIEAM